MKILTLVLISITSLTALSLTGFAQTPESTPTPQSEDVMKISTTLIQVNASVTDNKGNSISDLKPEDFELFENGKKQNITNVTFVGARSPQVKADKSSKSKENSDKRIQIPLTASEVKPEQIRRTLAFVIDDFNLSAESTYYVRKALRKFIDEQMQEGDLVAIVRLRGGIGTLQQFSSDKRILSAAVEKILWQPAFGGVGSGPTPIVPIAPTPEELANAGGLGATPLERGEVSSKLRDELIQAERNTLQRSNDFLQNSSVRGTLGGLTYIIRGMRDLPGRKSIMMMSDGFVLFSSIANSNNFNGVNSDLLKKLADAASRSSVVVYTMDAKGLQTLGFTAADNVQGSRNPNGRGGINELIRNRRDESFRTQESLISIAEKTGGLAVLDNNDFNYAIRKVLNDQSYYVIAYQPDEENFDPDKLKFNNLEVKVKRDNVKVRYNTGFFNVTDKSIEKPITLTPYQQMSAALISPFASNDITLNLNTVFRSDAKYNYFMNSFLYVSIKDLKFTIEPDGTKKSVFDLMAVTFGDNGNPLDAFSKTYTINVSAENYQKLLSEGFIYNFTLPLKYPGSYQMRVAIRDHATGKIGSASQFIEVPKLDKKRLTLSGIIVENLSRDLYEKGGNVNYTNTKMKNPDALADTALRIFKRGTVLRYGYEIYNAKSNKLQIKTRVYREGEIVFEGDPKPIELNSQSNAKIINSGGAINIGEEMQTGDYTLQIIITDQEAKEKYSIASQFVQFSIVE